MGFSPKARRLAALLLILIAPRHAWPVDSAGNRDEGDCLFVECAPFFDLDYLRRCNEDRERAERAPDYEVTFYYEVGGHFSAPYLVALAAGIDPTEARALSYWAQYPDLDWRYDAIRGLFAWDLGYSAQTYLHSLRGTWAAPVRTSLASYLSDPGLPVWKAGLAIHAFGDSFAHAYTVDRQPSPKPGDNEYLYRWPLGHALAWHAPDRIATDKAKFVRYLEALYVVFRLRASRAERRCLVEAAEALVQCREWNAETDEVDAFNCFGKLEHVAGRGRPRLEERLTRAQVREWVGEVAAPKLEGARATGESYQMIGE